MEVGPFEAALWGKWFDNGKDEENWTFLNLFEWELCH